MPHRFDSGLSVSLRRSVRQSVVDALQPLRKVCGGYLSGEVLELPAPLRFGTADDELALNDLLAGASPAVGVALGRSSFRRVDPTGDRWASSLTVAVYVMVRHARSVMSGLAGDVMGSDVTKDPGVEVVLEHVLERVAGLESAVPQIGRMILDSEEPAYYGVDWQVWEQLYRVEVDYQINRGRDIVGRARSVLIDHEHEGSPAEPAQALTTLGAS